MSARSVSGLTAAALLCAASAAKGVDTSIYRVTPAGWMLKHCVHDVPEGATLERTAAGVRVTHATGVYTIPVCDTRVNGVEMPMIHQPNRPAAQRAPQHKPGALRRLQFPPDYDGWLEYAAINSTKSYDVFTCNMSVPEAPTSPPDVLYLFPGLQNIDWIPIVDPLPSGAFDIIQPVLQYPGDQGLYWSVKSWWVTLDVGAMASNEVQLQVGDTVFGNMTRLSGSSYFIDSVSTQTRKHTSIVAKGLGTRLNTQPWGYVTLECYGCTSCDEEPAGNSFVAFTDIVVQESGGAPVTPAWRANPKPSKNRVCHESIEIASPTTVNIYFGTPSA